MGLHILAINLENRERGANRSPPDLVVRWARDYETAALPLSYAGVELV